jgi:hypothetical protein
MMTSTLTLLTQFRAAVYAAFDRRRDALFELLDTLLTAQSVPSPVHLSLEPTHRRGWGSLYAALARGKVRGHRLETLLARHPLLQGEPIYAVDTSSWPRCDAETSPDRGFYYHPSRHSAGQPIVAGWAYQWLAQLSFARPSVGRMGPRRCRCAGSIPQRMPIRSRPCRLSGSWPGGLLDTRSPCSSSMPGTIPSN